MTRDVTPDLISVDRAGTQPPPAAVPVGRPRDFTVRLPRGWVRLPVDDRADAAIARLLGTRFQSLPAPDRDRLRAGVRRDLREMVRRAAEAGGLDMFLSVDPVRGRPLAAGCVVTYVPPPQDATGPVAAADLLPLLGPPEGARDVESGLVPVAGVMAVRRRYRRDGDPDREFGNTAPSTHVDYLVGVPATAAHLLLSFSTTTAEVADALVVLFDAIAESMAWVW